MLVVVATKCFAMSVPPAASNQAFAACALAMVSCVLKVLLAMMNRVLAGSSLRSTGEISWPSTFDTKCSVRPGCANTSSAGTTICGPRSLPPIPMLTMCRMPLTAVSRTVSTYVSIASSTCCASALACRFPKLEPRGVRNAACITARPSVELIGSPRNMASRRSSTPHSRARSSRKCSVAVSIRFFDRSANTSGASMPIASKRPGSRANASRRSRVRPCASKCPASAAHASVRSQRMNVISTP